MMSKIIERNGAYFCLNCMMKQRELREQCHFCGAIFSNWESLQFKLYDEVRKDANRARSGGNCLSTDS